MTGVYLAMLIAMLFLAKSADGFIEKHRCHYCGELLGHEEHCPWNGAL